MCFIFYVQIDSCGQYLDTEHTCSANFYIINANTSLSDPLSANITVVYDKDIQCDEFVS